MRFTGDGFSIPLLKWRELVFIGALRAEGAVFCRDPARFMPPFAAGELFPEGSRFTAQAVGDRMLVRPLPPVPPHKP